MRRRSSRSRNELVRKGLRGVVGGIRLPSGTWLAPRAGGFRPVIEPDNLNQLVDALEIGEFTSETRRPDWSFPTSTSCSARITATRAHQAGAKAWKDLLLRSTGLSKAVRGVVLCGFE